MIKNVNKYNGMSLLDFVISYKGSVSKMFDTIEEIGYNTNETYYTDGLTTYRIDSLSNEITTSLSNITTNKDIYTMLNGGSFNGSFNGSFDIYKK